MRIVEVMGCTSAGKSTLVNQLLRAESGQAVHMAHSYDFVLDRFRAGWIKDHRIRMLVLNLVALGACLVAAHESCALLQFATGVIRRLPASIGWSTKLKLLRIVYRNIGIDAMLKHADSEQQIVVADEGILQIAHYLFVHVGLEPNLDEVAEFLARAPLPAQVLFLQQPLDILLERVRVRGHQRIPKDVPGATEDFVRHAIAVFDTIAQSPRLANRVTILDGTVFDDNRIPGQVDGDAVDAIQTTLAIITSGLAHSPTGNKLRGRLDYRISG